MQKKRAVALHPLLGNREADEADLLLPLFTDYAQELYLMIKPINLVRRLMVPITTPLIP